MKRNWDFIIVQKLVGIEAVVLILAVLLLLLLLLHPFISPFSRTTWVSWHKKGKPVYWSKWHKLDHVYATHLHLAPDR